MSEKIGKLIAARLKELDRGQAWLAERAHVSVNAVSKWTRTGRIKRENLELVAKALGVSVSELVAGEAEEAPAAPRSGSKLERLDPDESLLLELYRECRPGERELLISHARLLTNSTGSAGALRLGFNKT